MKIKNKLVRRILRNIYHWDTCPTEYQKDFSTLIFNTIMRASFCFMLIIGMMIIFLKLS